MQETEGVLLIEYPDGRASGDGYALFNNDADLKAALELNKQKIPNYSRYVELYKSSSKDLKAVSTGVLCDVFYAVTGPGLTTLNIYNVFATIILLEYFTGEKPL